jgi:hypothetical protein
MLSRLYYKHIVIVNDDSKAVASPMIIILIQVVVSPMIIILMSDAPSCGITYDHHSDDYSGICNCHSYDSIETFIMQVSLTIVNYNCKNIFTVQATEPNVIKLITSVI